MTMPEERTRAVLDTRKFLLEPSRDGSLPTQVRRDAKFLLRHFPTPEDIRRAGLIEERNETLPLDYLGPVFSSSISG
ncbi:hypothetical protein KC131_25605 [Pseudomonas sp. JQ170]|uniref:BPSL0761 family protein n=1 Tax=unclassified Pseudomonas TaxID=196821 RepID=UPI00264A8F62|nr:MULTISPECIES: BPSL0761 family protein [unclassified Pseudomonas]MDN7144024.1 hypothetical protein [Pseudomonas sp. JQ170]WRO74987.1 BPSL0761 family protein [Pseudomonas sp. 170C]